MREGIVTLTDADLAQIDQHWRAIRASHTRYGTATKKISAKLTEDEAQRIGAIGELAVQKVTRGTLFWDVTDRPDEGVDIVIGEHKCHVKTFTYTAPDILFFVNNLAAFSAPVGIGVQLLDDHHVRIMGCISRAKFVRDMFHHSLGYGDLLCVKQASLSSLTVLVHTVFWEQYDYAGKTPPHMRQYPPPPEGAEFCWRCQGGGCRVCDYFGWLKVVAT